MWFCCVRKGLVDCETFDYRVCIQHRAHVTFSSNIPEYIAFDLWTYIQWSSLFKVGVKSHVCRVAHSQTLDALPFSATLQLQADENQTNARSSFKGLCVCVHKQPIVRDSFIRRVNICNSDAEWLHSPDCFWSNDIKPCTLTLPVCCACA